MDVPASARDCGDVYCHEGRYFVIVAGSGRRVLIAPIVYQNVPAMRHDIVVHGWGDLDAMGLPGGRYIVRVAWARALDPFSLPRVGRMSQAMMLRLADMAGREAQDQAFEERHRAAVV